LNQANAKSATSTIPIVFSMDGDPVKDRVDAAMDGQARVHQTSGEQNFRRARCIEGNYGLPGLLHGHRVQELDFAKGQGIDPRTITTVAGGNDEPDPLQ
jgi:hypothetical protein